MDSQERHERLVKLLNDFYGREEFTIKKKKLSPYKSETNNKYHGEIINAVGLIADTMNYTGGSVGEVDLYQLVGQYLTNEAKRSEINKILRGRQAQ